MRGPVSCQAMPQGNCAQQDWDKASLHYAISGWAVERDSAQPGSDISAGNSRLALTAVLQVGVAQRPEKLAALQACSSGPVTAIY
eukprot:1159148-Pelagomonas_calceolata.AAC.19